MALDDLADQIIGLTEKSMRQEIEKIPDGIYRAEGIVEQMKGKEDVVIKAAVEVKGSDILVDLGWVFPPGQLGWQCRLQFHLCLRIYGHEKHVWPGHPQQ